MNRRRIEILLAILILIAVIVLLWWLFSRGGDGPAPDEQVPEPVPEDELFFEEPTDMASPVLMPDPVVRTFVERFGSFSTEADYSNVEDVLAISTPELQAELQSLAEEARRENQGAYYGVNTFVLTLETVSSSDTTVQMVVTTQREEAFGDPGNTSVRVQDIVIDLVLVDGEWLVRSFEWQ